MIKFKCGDLYSSGLRCILNLFPDDERRIIGTLDSIYGGVTRLPGLTTMSNLFVLYLVAEEYNAPDRHILEIGTNYGKSAYVLALAAPEASIITVEKNRECWLFAKALHQDGMPYPETSFSPTGAHLIYMDSTDYFKSYRGPNMDMVFIDGDHQDGVLVDAGWWNRLNVGGCLLFHDYYSLYPRVIEVVDHMKEILGREPEIQLLADSCLVGFYKVEGDPEWKY